MPLASGRECRLFSDLSRALVEGPSSAFAILNSLGEVDIESMSWSVVPRDIQSRVLSDTDWMIFAGEIYPSKTIGIWTVWRKLILFAEAKPWCVVWINTHDPDYAQQMVREETRPIFPAD